MCGAAGSAGLELAAGKDGCAVDNAMGTFQACSFAIHHDVDAVHI
jgi:hypothetical protein